MIFLQLGIFCPGERMYAETGLPSVLIVLFMSHQTLTAFLSLALCAPGSRSRVRGTTDLDYVPVLGKGWKSVKTRGIRSLTDLCAFLLLFSSFLILFPLSSSISLSPLISYSHNLFACPCLLSIPSLRPFPFFLKMLALNFFATFLAAASLVSGAVTAPICVNLDIKVLVLDLGSTCICATASGLTPQTLVNLKAGASNNSGLLGLLGQTVNSILALAEPIALGLLSTKSTSCTYPSNSVPNDCSGSCGFTCATGYQRCSGQCVANGQTCISPGTRRRNLNARSRNPCPGSMTACPVSTLSGSAGFECIDTKANIESCGGCISPFPGATTGFDCTSIPHVGSVECQQSKCVVLDCERGYSPNHNATACVPKQALSLGRLITEGAPLIFSK